MTLRRRVALLEAGAGFGVAPAACWIYADGRSEVYLYGSGEWMPKAECDRRWPNHPHLKAYGDRRMAVLFDEVGWSDAPPPRSSADR